MIEVERLRPADAAAYERIVRESPAGMLFHGLKWRDLLADFTGAEPVYLAARDGGKIAGVLPAFLKRNDRCGNVLNSLPFFGSHGGVLLARPCPRRWAFTRDCSSRTTRTCGSARSSGCRT